MQNKEFEFINYWGEITLCEFSRDVRVDRMFILLSYTWHTIVTHHTRCIITKYKSYYTSHVRVIFASE